MPRTIKLFLVLCLVYSAWLVWTNIGFLAFPPRELVQLRGTLPADIRASAERADWTAAAMRILIPLGFLLTLAALAAFTRKNWARWTFAILLIAGVGFAFIRAAAAQLILASEIFHGSYFDWDNTARVWLTQWRDWPAWVWLALKLALIATIFSPGAKDWFRHLAPAHQD